MRHRRPYALMRQCASISLTWSTSGVRTCSSCAWTRLLGRVVLRGAGIYRHVWLTMTAPVNVVQWGTVIRSEVHGNRGTLNATSEVQNENATAESCTVNLEVIDPGGKVVAVVRAKPQTVEAGESATFQCQLSIAELFLNGTSLGTKTVIPNSHLEWNVPYANGVLEACGFKKGKMVLPAKRETTGEPARLTAEPDRIEIAAGGRDISIIAVKVADASGRVVPTRSNEIRFELSGPGRLIGTGNGEPPTGPRSKNWLKICAGTMLPLRASLSNSRGLQDRNIFSNVQPYAQRHSVHFDVRRFKR